MKPTDSSISVTNIVFGPTLLAYFWIIVNYVISGLLLYAIFLGVAYKLGLFSTYKQWPWIARSALCLGPVLISLGVFCSTQKTSYWMAAPGMLYMVWMMFAGLALRGFTRERR